MPSFFQMLLAAILAFCAAGMQAAERWPGAGELEAVFQPYPIEAVALSPDGLHVAWVSREGARLSLVVVAADRPNEILELPVGEDARAGVFRRQVTMQARVPFLRWAAPGRLVYAASVPHPERNESREEVRLLEVGTRRDRKVVDAVDLAGGTGSQPVPRRPVIVGLHPENPDLLFVEALPAAEPMPALFQVSLSSGNAEMLFQADQPGRYLYDAAGRARIVEPMAPAAAEAQNPLQPELPPPTPEPSPDLPATDEPAPPPAPRPRPMGTGIASPTSEYWPPVYHFRSVEGSDWQPLDRFRAEPATRGFRLSSAPAARSLPLAIGADPNVLYFASNVDRETFGLYALDLANGRRTEFELEDPRCDLAPAGNAFAESPLIFDRQIQLTGIRLPGGTRWLQPGLARMQQELDRAFAGRQTEILDWDTPQRRVLVRVFGPADPGRIFLVGDGSPLRITELARRGQRPAPASRTEVFGFESKTGAWISGTLVLPRRTRGEPPGLILLCPDLPGLATGRESSREAHALAALGFAVATIHYRGLEGFGLRHRDAIRASFDAVPAEDLVEAAAWLTSRHRFSGVALLGEGFGGFLAIRTAQRHPGSFHCAVGINVPIDPQRWVFGRGLLGFAANRDEAAVRRRAYFEREKLEGLELTRHVSEGGRPMLIVQDTDHPELTASDGRRLRDAARRRHAVAELIETDSAFTRGEPAARARVFAGLGEFLATHLASRGESSGNSPK